MVPNKGVKYDLLVSDVRIVVWNYFFRCTKHRLHSYQIYDIIHLAIFSLLIADEVKEGDEGLATQLVNQLALPEEHNVALHFYGFFLHKIERVD